MSCMANGTASNDISEDGLGSCMDVQQVKLLVSKGGTMEQPSSKELLVQRPLRAPADRPDINPGQYARLLGDEPVKTYVPLLLRPGVMECSHREAVHLGEKMTLGSLHKFHWWIGMDESAKWWLRRCYTCQARESTRQTVR